MRPPPGPPREWAVDHQRGRSDTRALTTTYPTYRRFRRLPLLVQGSRLEHVMDENLIDPQEAARRLGVTRRWLYDHLPELPHLRLGRAIRFRPSELDGWLDKQRPAASR